MIFYPFNCPAFHRVFYGGKCRQGRVTFTRIKSHKVQDINTYHDLPKMYASAKGADQDQTAPMEDFLDLIFYGAFKNISITGILS